MGRLFLLILTAKLTWAQRSPAPPSATSLDAALHGTIDRRIQAMKTIDQQNLITDPAVRRAVVDNLIEESNDPDWSDLAESLDYSAYYGNLLTTGQKIAAQYNDRRAWKALVSGVYNDDSPYAVWLSEQPNALPALIQAAHVDAHSTVHDTDITARVLYVLAQALQRCESKPAGKTCVLVQARRNQILQEIRNGLKYSAVSYWAVRALTLCGDAQDIELVAQAAVEPRGELTEEQIQKEWDSVIRWAQNAIRERTQAKK